MQRSIDEVLGVTHFPLHILGTVCRMCDSVECYECRGGIDISWLLARGAAARLIAALLTGSANRKSYSVVRGTTLQPGVTVLRPVHPLPRSGNGACNHNVS